MEAQQKFLDYCIKLNIKNFKVTKLNAISGFVQNVEIVSEFAFTQKYSEAILSIVANSPKFIRLDIFPDDSVAVRIESIFE